MPLSKSSTDALLLASTYTVFISAGHPSYTPKEAMLASQRLVGDIALQGHYYKPVEGVYKGKRELSYMVRCDSVFDLLQLQALGHKYMQECIMIIDDPAGKVLLNYSGQQTSIIGFELVQIGEYFAKTYDSYSIIDGEYWVVV